MYKTHFISMNPNVNSQIKSLTEESSFCQWLKMVPNEGNNYTLQQLYHHLPLQHSSYLACIFLHLNISVHLY